MCVCVEDEEDEDEEEGEEEVVVVVVGGVKSGFDPQLKGLFVLQLTNPEFNLVLSCLLNPSPPSSLRVLPSLPASLPLSPSSLSFSLTQSYHPLAAS